MYIDRIDLTQCSADLGEVDDLHVLGTLSMSTDSNMPHEQMIQIHDTRRLTAVTQLARAIMGNCTQSFILKVPTVMISQARQMSDQAAGSD